MRPFFSIFILSLFLIACKSEPKQEVQVIETETNTSKQKPDRVTQNDPEIIPISHATAVIKWDDTVIYLDPVGGSEAFKGQEAADLVLITDIHGDHMDEKTLEALKLGETRIIVPEAVKKELPNSLSERLVVMNNGETKDHLGISIKAIPMYNLREEAKQYHPKGRGNGYLLEKDGKRLYIAGDTEDIPEMRNLENIDIALVPMNLPYTMTEEKAAEAVLEFQPKVVYPYHYRGKEGKSDVEKFKKLVNEGNKDIKVVLKEWYPKEG